MKSFIKPEKKVNKNKVNILILLVFMILLIFPSVRLNLAYLLDLGSTALTHSAKKEKFHIQFWLKKIRVYPVIN